MSCQKIAIRAILLSLWKKWLSARAVTKEIDDVEDLITVNEIVAQNCFWRFRESDTRLEHKPRSRRPVMEDNNLTTVEHMHLYIVVWTQFFTKNHQSTPP